MMVERAVARGHSSASPLKSLMACVAVSALSAVLWAAPASAQDKVIVGLITKTDTNPFFVKMKEGAEAEGQGAWPRAAELRRQVDGDNEGQVAAIENLISAGAKGILITPSDTKAIVPTIEKARDAGILVIALDTPLDPIDAADATFATDNFKAGELIGQWAAKTLGDRRQGRAHRLPRRHRVQPTVDVLRDQGFMKGFGIDIKDPTDTCDEDDPRIVGHQWGAGAEEGGRTGMENLLQKDPTISVVYTINEPTAAGALRSAEGGRPRRRTC